MKKIQMVELHEQYLKIKNEIDAAMQDVINTTAFINGPQVVRFQDELKKYLNVKHVIGCANGTDALQIAMMALDLKAGDEIITTAFTFVATVEVVALLGLKPVFVDVNPDTFNIDPVAIEKAITLKTKAIVPVHLFGQCADMQKIKAIAEKNKLFIIEDTCQAIGADYHFENGTTLKAGTIGEIGCLSFFPSKNLGCYGDGGALLTNNDALAEQLKIVVNHGMKIRYYHDMVGVNSRLDALQAAILNVKLKYLDQYIDARNKAASYYNQAFSNHPKIMTPFKDANSTHVFHQYTLKLKNVDQFKLQEYMNSKGIPVMIYYPVPLHLQKAYRYLGYKEGDLPVTEQLCKSVISLPMHTELDEEQLSFITTNLLDYLSK